MSLLIKNWSKADWEDLLKWAKIGANNAMIGEFTEVEELPPHGRLGDLDALAEEDNRQYNEYRKDNGLDDTCHRAIQWMLSSAPTIIPAEEGE